VGLEEVAHITVSQFVRNGARDRTALLVLCGLALALRLWGLTRQSLWIDEMFSLKYAGFHGPLTWESLRLNLHGPLHAALLYLWTRPFGWGEASMRGLSVLFSVAAVPALYFAVRPVAGRNRALIASGLLAVNPFHVWYAQEVRNYTLVMLASIGSLAMVRRMEERPRPGTWLALAGVWVAGLLSNLSMAFQIAASGAWGVVRFARRPRALAGLLAAGVVALVALLPWELEFYKRQVSSSYLLRAETVPSEERLRGDATAPILGIPYAIYAFSAGFSLGPSLRELRRDPSVGTISRHPIAIGVTAVLFGTLAAAGLWTWLRGGPARRLWLCAFLVPILLAFVAAERNVKVFNPRYLAVAFPAYMLLLAEGAGALGKRWGAVLLGGVVLVSAWSLVQLQTMPRYWKEDARAATRVLRAEVDPGDLVFVVGTWDPIQRYYWKGVHADRAIHRYFVPFRVGPGSESDQAEARAAIQGAARTYVLFYRDDFHDPQGLWERFLGERYAVDRTWEFPGVRIWRLGSERAG
jgi:hypothetical protein